MDTDLSITKGIITPRSPQCIIDPTDERGPASQNFFHLLPVSPVGDIAANAAWAERLAGVATIAG
ncbi:MAG: hypothetical protein JJU36_16875 [Phycisphaeraceae bacterium]|nr:hypothetical protein [Phycisphaeraceae bacterium]